jgi:hypothetical protein
MKRLRQLIRRFRAAIHILLRFGAQHQASLSALEKRYVREWKEPQNGTRCSVKLDIQQQGSLYLVTQQYYTNDQYKVTESWLATYGWHCNGHLIGIGRHCYLICDPIRQLLLLENWPDDGDRTVEIYHLN